MSDRITLDEKPDYDQIVTHTKSPAKKMEPSIQWTVTTAPPERESPMDAARRVDATDKEAERDLDRDAIAERATLAVMVDQLQLSVHGVNRPEVLCRRAIKRALDLLYRSGPEHRPEMIKMSCDALARMTEAGDAT